MLRNVSVLLLLSIDLMFVYATSDFLNGIPTLSSPQEDYVYGVCVLSGLVDARVFLNPFYHAIYRRYVQLYHSMEVTTNVVCVFIQLVFILLHFAKI